MRGFYSKPLYKKLPISLQNAFVTFKGACYIFLRKGATYSKFRNRVKGAEHLSKNGMAELQLGKLRETLAHAYEHVPYYRSAFKAIGFKPDDLRSINDLSLLPVINKDTVRQDQDGFLAETARKKRLIKGSSSGTTGKRLCLYMDRDLIKYEYAFADRQYRWAGVSAGSRAALIRGDLIVPSEKKEPPFWRYDAFNKQMWFSSYHISDATVGAYAKKLEEYGPEVIFTYPSSIYSLCQCAKANGIAMRMPGLKSIITSSETLYPHRRKFIEDYLGVSIFDWYGHFERLVFIGTCERGNYHLFPDYGIAEFFPIGSDENGEQLYEIVGTGFINKAMPLIRYRTGDIVTLCKEAGCPCGRPFPRVKSIIGRVNDVITTRSGRRIGYLEFVFQVDNVRTGQIIQESYDTLRLLVVPEAAFTEENKQLVIRKLRERIDEDMRIDFECVKEIPLTSNGKFRTLISKVQ